MPRRGHRTQPIMQLQGTAHLLAQDMPELRRIGAEVITTTEVTRILIQNSAAGRLTLTQLGDFVRITGPADDRSMAFSVLMSHGLSCAPYPDHDDWTRR